MDYENAFLYQNLTPYDQIVFAKALQTVFQLTAFDSCFCVKKNTNALFKGFNTSKPKRLLYKNKDARPLILAMTGRFPDEINNIVVRKSICNSPYCLNPFHYYWGTRSDVALENAKRKKISLNNDLITKLRIEYQEGINCSRLSKTYKIPYHTVRRICNKETYEETKEKEDIVQIWNNLSIVSKELVNNHPDETKQFQLRYHMTNELECPWHKQKESTHKGNFGKMGECLDCMEEIKKGRCSIDVKNFDVRTWYWQVKRFWDQVDIQGSDECWKWQGATRKNGTESTAYFPSPFHSAKTQSASRVAFWLSRGYTGKYRIFSRPTCTYFCCNPMHLTIKELKDSPEPNEVKTICLTHGNIFKHYKDKKSSIEEE